MTVETNFYADKLRGKNIVVFGGTSGIGFGAAEAFLSLGAHVTIVSSNPDNLNSALTRLKNHSNLQGKIANVRDEAATVNALLELAPIDHLVFTAVDLIIRGELADLDLDRAKELFGVKFWGSVVVGKAVAKHDIIKPGGSLTLTSGTAGFLPRKGAAVGGALNGAVFSLTRGLAGDLAAKKIRVNTVVPGLVKTELWDKLGKTKEEQEETFQKGGERLLTGFVATPDDIAEAYVYAVRANYSTGQLITIDGGGVLI
ncbi:hypothetical protein HK097_005335 [Rhizophlyctis rosea]|uniref:NAD(P)-binding protein n=1 Tax=Rhizophlyctis rosea TaxID=64517 RepID=A0AAD5X630_9FUNG|nr:hypothetical protein HK097_005335 [Rhizophlyctis rosea]